MRHFSLAGAVVAAAATGAAADLCSRGSYQLHGNWYCQAVTKIQYNRVGSSGQYNEVIEMNAADGSCKSEPRPISGSLAPFHEDVSLHFRGNIHLKQFAVYLPPQAPALRLHRRHAHGNAHQHHHEARAAAEPLEKRDDMITATINGHVVSWKNPNPAAPTAAPAAAHACGPRPPIANATYAAPTAPGGPGDWTRVGYYNAAAGAAYGLTFLGNYGGQGSGVFDNSFGNSLSYLGQDGVSGCACPEILNNVPIPSNKEFAIMSDRPCKDGDCGYTRPGSVAYHGWEGTSKTFLFEFTMPSDSTAGFNADMPAIWLLNGRIPRTLQYGKPQCSCWTSGCGEFDIFEVLDSGNTRAKSTMHGIRRGGCSDYFERPVDKTIKLAVAMHDDDITIEVLDDATEFGGYLPSSVMTDVCSGKAANGLFSTFDAYA